MRDRIHATHVALLVFVAVGGAGGCTLLSGSRGGPGQVGDLVGWTERLYVESEVGRVRVREALDRLQALASADFSGDPVLAHAAFVESIEASEEQARRMRETVDPMKKAAGPVFDQWAIDLEAYANRSMRERSKARLASTRARFDAVVDAADPALAGFEELNRGLRDHALYLANDFNPDAIASISEDVRAMVTLAAELDGRFDACMRASREYVVAAAPPSRGTSPVDGTDPTDEPAPEQAPDRGPDHDPGSGGGTTAARG